MMTKVIIEVVKELKMAKATKEVGEKAMSSVVNVEEASEEETTNLQIISKMRTNLKRKMTNFSLEEEEDADEVMV